jgi:uncharacterized 2Fe-2S/4Fe-4S cluster protein (DUF4445 family)
MAKNFHLDFEPTGRRVESDSQTTLLDAARAGGVELMSVCGGVGTCYECKVRIAKGEVTPITDIEKDALTSDQLANNFRLGCQCSPLSDVKIDIPPESLSTPQRLQVEGQGADVALDPVVQVFDVHLEPPTLHDLRSDASRLIESVPLDRLTIGLPLLSSLSSFLRQNSWKIRAVIRSREVIAILPQGESVLGLAVDIGTTKVAGYLVDLQTGATRAKAGAMNPQIGYGEDVISRIHYANTHTHGRRTLQEKIVEGLNQLVDDLCALALCSRDQIVEAVIVGNTVMQHLFAGLPVEQLGAAPYVPAVSDAIEFRAHEIGLRLAPGAYVYLPPNIAGYVGADHVSMALAAGIGETNQTVIGLDIGTNTEISLAHNGRVICCSCPSGPAFEGAHIQDGMRAAPGAIERVQIRDNEIKVHTIADQPAVGICGSGILDALAELIKAGAVDARGSLKVDHPLVRTREKTREVVLVDSSKSGHGRDVVITRKDINEIQLAKGAIRAGIEILIKVAGIEAGALDAFIVAGAFGTYLDLESAIRAGMFLDLPRERFSQIGNAAGSGARRMLVSKKQRAAAGELARRMEYIELTVHKDFERMFVKGMMF